MVAVKESVLGARTRNAVRFPHKAIEEAKN